MLYTVFMFWMVVSISVVAVSMVFGGVLCVWCAFIGRRRFRRDAASLIVHRHPSSPLCPISIVPPNRSSPLDLLRNSHARLSRISLRMTLWLREHNLPG